MGNIFRKELIQASSDGVIDKSEWLALKITGEAVKANQPLSADAQLASQVLPFLDSVQVQTRIGYTLNGPEKTQLQFNFSPNFSESERVPGRSPREQVNYFAQRDNLPENHFVAVFREQGKFYLADTGASDNGKGNAVRELDAEQVKAFVYLSSGSVLGISRW